ncbi:MAG TPA: OsmC family protein [Gemmatimonadaceae bacterium]
MKIVLTGDESLRLEPTAGPLTIESPSKDRGYSPFHMLGSALGSCTFSVLQSWASNKNIGVGDLHIDVDWKFLEGQHRVESMRVKLDWPSLSPELWPRAIRAAHLCGIHQTLTRQINITVDAAQGEAPAIEKVADLAQRGSAKAPAAMAQADGQPRSNSP